MPVAQQHHHVLSAIGTFLHALQPTSHHNTSSFHASSAHLYQAFESQLAQRLSSLLPSDDSPSVCLPSLKQFMALLLATQTDLRTLVPTHHSHSHTKSMEEFLERSIKLLDVCRGIKEQMLELEGSQGMLHLVIFCLNSDIRDMSQCQVNRARKALAQFVLHIDVDRDDQTDHVQTHRSFRGRIRERLGGSNSRESSPHRWRSWQRHHLASPLSHGNQGSASSSGLGNLTTAHGNNASAVGSVPMTGNHVAVPSLQGNHGVHGAAGSSVHAGGNLTLELNLLPPRLPPKDEEECFCAALYALNVLSIFSLGTISAAFPSVGKTHRAGFINPPHAAQWASPFLCLQEKVDEELRKRSKKRGGYAGMWELDQISSLAKRLYDFISLDDVVKLDDNIEEVKKVVKMLCQHVEELDRDMGALHLQIKEFYSRVVAARMGVLELLSDVNDSTA